MPESWTLPRGLKLPKPQPVEFAVERIEREAGGFLRRVSRTLRIVGNELPQGATQAFDYDEVERRGLDAIVIVPHFVANDEEGAARRWVVLRSAARPPVLFRDSSRFQGSLGGAEPLWEVPAGLVEPDEETDHGLVLAAARELEEETGFLLAPSEIVRLGASAYPCPGVIAERQYFFAADVTGAPFARPSLDGSPLEFVGEVFAIPLDGALRQLEQFVAVDLKTEVALRRLEAKFG
jgi:8-oxo-dGTP pyrophosphatase MutT (NUDIX family)